MVLADISDAGARIGKRFLVNLPAVVLFCGGYFLFFSAVWGPLRPWKIAMAMFLVIGLCLSLQVRSPTRAARRERARGRHEAEALALWPPWRRVAAVLTGAALCFVGVYQSLGIDVNIGKYPLLSGLCLIVSIAVGAILIGLGWPRTRWKRRGAKRSATDTSRSSKSASPKRGARTGGTSLHVPTPRAGGYSGLWGGVGFGPSAPVWKPGGPSRAPSSEPVPRRFQKLRLVRRLRSRITPPSPSIALLLILLVVGFVGTLIYLCCA